MRIKLEMPSVWHYQNKFDVRVYDLNYGNHVGNDTLLRFAHELRLKYFSSINQSELNFFGQSLIMADAAIEFLAQMVFEDNLTGKVAIQNVRSSSFDLYYSFHNQENRETSRLKTAMVFFDYKNNRPVKRTQAFETYLETIS